MKLKSVVVLVLLASGASLFWGVYSHRNRVFPYSLLRTLYLNEDGSSRDPQVVQSRSEAFRRLAAIPYINASFDPDHENTGVVSAKLDRTFRGASLYNSKRAKSAQLIDMKGAVLHEWSYETADYWHSTELLPNGDLLVIEQNTQLIRLNVKSELLWAYKGRVHHALDVFEEKIYILEDSEAVRPEIDEERPTLIAYISILGLDGIEVERVSILDLLLSSPYAFLLPSLDPSTREGDRRSLDILHTNHIELFDGRHADRSPIFERGSVLLSLRNLNAILILDKSMREILWLWGPGNLTFQHHPRFLDNGNLLIFDNGIERSRILEIDPVNLDIVWSYEADDFFSETQGGVQRLRNGNTLITESNSGWVFEVDREGRIVWSFANPDVDEFGNRGAIYRMTRYAPEDLPFLGG